MARRHVIRPLDPDEEHLDPTAADRSPATMLLGLQRNVGNQAVAAALARRRRGGTNTIVDDAADPENAEHPGHGRGLMQQPGGDINELCHFGPLHNGVATEMNILELPDVDHLGGTEPEDGTWPDWWKAPHKPRSHHYWVRGHLLNHNIGGPGESRNLTPITKSCNSQHHTLVEKLCKQAAAENAVIEYSVTAIYDDTGPTLTRDRDKDPARELWPHITRGFHCEWDIVRGPRDTEHGVEFIENAH